MRGQMESHGFRVRGQVQGVGFRYWTQRQAVRIGLSGFVRNLPDGSVEIVAHGTPAQVAHLYALLKQGPGSARVDQIDRFTPHHPPASETGNEMPAPYFVIAN